MCVSWDVYVECCHLVTRTVTSIQASVAYRYFHIMKIAVTQMTPRAHMRVPLYAGRLSVHPSPVSCTSLPLSSPTRCPQPPTRPSPAPRPPLPNSLIPSVGHPFCISQPCLFICQMVSGMSSFIQSLFLLVRYPHTSSRTTVFIHRCRHFTVKQVPSPTHTFPSILSHYRPFCSSSPPPKKNYPFPIANYQLDILAFVLSKLS